MTDTPISSAASIAVIGAGIVGVASACELARRGYEVTVYDPEPPGEAGPSRANAGHVAASDIYPLSAPGIHWKALKMLLNRDGPLKIPVRDAVAHIPWFWRFWHTSRSERFEAATNALRYLCSRTLTDTGAMLEAAGMSDMILQSGCAFLYDTDKSFNASHKGWAGKAAAGFGSETMDASRIARDIPAIADQFRHGVLSHQWSMVREPLDVVRGLASAAESKGVLFSRTRVDSLVANLNSVKLETDQGMRQHDAVVIAAGLGSVTFARSCGDFLPIAAERGYNLTAPEPGIELDLSLVFADRGIVATQLTSGLRIGGWAEYAHPDRPANQNYFKSIARISKELFPGLKLDHANFWMGSRPSLPDSVPVISRSASANRVYYNCGHGHYGLTHSATSASILADLIGDSSKGEKYRSYAITRFSNTIGNDEPYLTNTTG
jgi:D-amino-acid dehydrogenase